MRLDPPLDPTSPQARDWLEDELSRAIYRDDRSLQERLLDWINELLSRTGAGGLPGWTIAVAIVFAAAVLALVVARSVRAERRMTGSRIEGVLDGPSRSAAEHRAAASRALAAGDHDTAVVESYRAIARSAIERTLLDDLPGRTAHEVSVALGPVFPASAARLASAADTFDAVLYGRRAAAQEAAREVAALDATLAETRPVLPELTPTSGGLR